VHYATLVRHFHYLGIGLTGPISAAICAMVLQRTVGRLIAAAAGSRQEKRVAPFLFGLFNDFIYITNY